MGDCTVIEATADVYDHRKQMEHVVCVDALVRHVAQFQLKREHHAVHQLAQPACMRPSIS